MLIKTKNKDGSFVRTDDCVTACVIRDIKLLSNDNNEKLKETGEGNYLICTYNSPHRFDATYPLNKDDKVYFMNESGKTIDLIRI